MKKKTSIIIGVIVAIIIAMIAGGVAVSGVLNPYEKQIKLGYKMINEEKYEEAVLAFNTAIEIDQRKEKAYIGLADTYVSRCDENTVNDANDALRRGYEQAQSEKIVQGYISSAQTLYDKDKKDWAIQLLEKGYEITTDEKIEVKRKEFIKMIGAELLDKLFKYCESDNLEEVRKIMGTEEFSNIANMVIENNPIVYLPNDKENNKNGKGIGIYKTNKGYFIYFGDYVNEVRNGEGVLIAKDEDYVFRGAWSNDKPNGTGTNYFYEDGNLIIKDYGNVIDGFWDGIVYFKDIDGNEEIDWERKYNNGTIIWESHDPDEQGDNYTDSKQNELQGVLGFAKEGY